MSGINWTEVAVKEAFIDWDWQHIAEVLHKLIEKEENTDYRRILIFLAEFAEDVHELYGEDHDKAKAHEIESMNDEQER